MSESQREPFLGNVLAFHAVVLRGTQIIHVDDTQLRLAGGINPSHLIDREFRLRGYVAVQRHPGVAWCKQGRGRL